MGWLTTHKPDYQTLTEFFSEHLNYRNDTAYGKVVCCIKVDDTVYLAFEEGSIGTSTPRVMAIVCPIEFYPGEKYHNFGYECITEEVGPYQINCPESILNKLTKTDAEYAISWREKCWAKVREDKGPRLYKGLAIRFPKPLSFSNGDQVQDFIVLDGRKMLFINPNNQGMKYQISKDLMRYAEVVNKPSGPRILEGSLFAV